MLTYVAHNLIDDTDLYDNGREIVAFPHIPASDGQCCPAYVALLAEIDRLQIAPARPQHAAVLERERAMMASYRPKGWAGVLRRVACCLTL